MSRTNIFIPEKINVGYQKRSDTYTGQLAYVIYFDAKGKLRKEASWNGWRNKNIPNDIFENVPTSGFVLNKKAGGYSSGWNHRQSYVRIYDPRGFEFEITIPNLLYILENANSIKGKGLEGEFVYGWDGKDHLLVPVDSPDYEEIINKAKEVDTNVYLTPKQFIIGATYRDKDGHEYIYMGKHDEYSWSGEKMKTKSFYFYKKGYNYHTTMKSVSKKFIECVDAEKEENFDKMWDNLQCHRDFSPIDENKDVFTPYTFEEIVEKMNKNNGAYCTAYAQKDGRYITIRREHSWHGRNNDDFYYYVEARRKSDGYSYWGNIETIIRHSSLEEIVEKIVPSWRTQYHANGRLYKEEKY